jgi:hypothetical protein
MGSLTFSGSLVLEHCGNLAAFASLTLPANIAKCSAASTANTGVLKSAKPSLGKWKERKCGSLSSGTFLVVPLLPAPTPAEFHAAAGTFGAHASLVIVVLLVSGGRHKSKFFVIRQKRFR